MDLLLFGGSLSLGLFVGLTLKKHKVFLIPQSLGIMMTNREFFDNVQKEQEQQDRDNYFAGINSTRHLNAPRK